ncbi:MAG: hypothetical protein AB7N24_00840 [Dehalococcoidia bacterium]
MALATAYRPASLATGIRTNKFWAWAGLGTVVLGFLFTWAPALFGISDAEAKDPALLVSALDTNANLWLGRVSSGVGFLAVGALIVFASGYRRLLAERMPGSLVPGVAYTALVATAGALITASVFRAMLFDSFDYYDDSVHAAFYALSWDVALASWTVFYVVAVASAVAAFRGALPKWFGWLSMVTATLGIVLALVGLAFPAHMPAMLWLVCASIVAIRAGESPAVA